MNKHNKDFYKRKIQKFSKYSYAITLPSDWIKKHHLERSQSIKTKEWKEDVDPAVNIYEMPDGHLEIYVDKDFSPEEPNLARIDLDEFIDNNPKFIEQKSIQMILISYYMNGSKGLEIISKNSIPNEIIHQIENTQSKLLFNWNMSKISSRRILIKTVFKERAKDIFQEQIPRFLRESFAVLLGILEDFIASLESDDCNILKNVPTRDKKIDRYYFFTVRQIRTIFERPKLSEPLNFSHKKLVDLRLLAKFIEDVGDIFKEIAIILVQIKGFLKEINLKEYLLEYFKVLYNAYSLLSDELRKSLSSQDTTVGMNEQIMDLIENFREDGMRLEERWGEVADQIEVSSLISDYEFSDFFQGSRLVKNLEESFKKVFDFTNLFF